MTPPWTRCRSLAKTTRRTTLDTLALATQEPLRRHRQQARTIRALASRLLLRVRPRQRRPRRCLRARCLNPTTASPFAAALLIHPPASPGTLEREQQVACLEPLAVDSPPSATASAPPWSVAPAPAATEGDTHHGADRRASSVNRECGVPRSWDSADGLPLRPGVDGSTSNNDHTTSLPTPCDLCSAPRCEGDPFVANHGVPAVCSASSASCGTSAAPLSSVSGPNDCTELDVARATAPASDSHTAGAGAAAASPVAAAAAAAPAHVARGGGAAARVGEETKRGHSASGSPRLPNRGRYDFSQCALRIALVDDIALNIKISRKQIDAASGGTYSRRARFPDFRHASLGTGENSVHALLFSDSLVVKLNPFLGACLH